MSLISWDEWQLCCFLDHPHKVLTCWLSYSCSSSTTRVSASLSQGPLQQVQPCVFTEVLLEQLFWRKRKTQGQRQQMICLLISEQMWKGTRGRLGNLSVEERRRRRLSDCKIQYVHLPPSSGESNADQFPRRAETLGTSVVFKYMWSHAFDYDSRKIISDFFTNSESEKNILKKLLLCFLFCIKSYALAIINILGNFEVM